MRDLLRHRVDVEERVLTDDAYMSSTAEWVKVIRNLRCRLEPMSEREKTLFHREGATLTHRLFFKPIRQVIDSNVSRVVFGSRTFEVVGSRDEDETGRLMVLHLHETYEPTARTA